MKHSYKINNLWETKILQMQYIKFLQYYVVLSSRFSMIVIYPGNQFYLIFPYVIYLKEISIVVIVAVLNTFNLFLLEIPDSL